MQSTAIPPNTTFHYPRSSQYPFDLTTQKILRALQERSWNFPSIDIQFADRISHNQNFRKVSLIRGADFLIQFDRYQKYSDPAIFPYGYLSDNAAASHIAIPQKNLTVTGSEPQTLLETHTDSHPQLYTPSTTPHSISPSLRRAPYLVTLNPPPNTPPSFDTKAIFDEFTHWLQTNVLHKIESAPIPPPTPYPAHLGPFYIATVDTYRIRAGKSSRSKLPALHGGGQRLLPAGIPHDDTLPSSSLDSFRYCTFIKPLPAPPSFGTIIVKITPTHADHIFVIDDAALAPYRARQTAPLTPDESLEWQKIIARTLIPIADYKGDYAAPSVLIDSHRDITFDEVEIV